MKKESQYEDPENECYIWEARQGLKVTERRLRNHDRIIGMNGWLRELDMNVMKKV